VSACSVAPRLKAVWLVRTVSADRFGSPLAFRDSLARYATKSQEYAN
jgi:hypothetical protein